MESELKKDIDINILLEQQDSNKKNKHQIIDLRWYFHLSLLIIGLFGLQMISKRIAILFLSVQYEDSFSAYVNFLGYGTIFLFLLTVVFANLDKFKPSLKKGTNYFIGLGFGFGVLFGTIILNMIIMQVAPEVEKNDNETAVRSIVSLYPFLSLIIFGIVGPICEELTYRVGLFSFVSKKNKVLAYIITMLVFGFIHFNFEKIGSVNEWLNLPLYLYSGFMLTLAYEYYGLPACAVAHMTNNIISVLANIAA